MKYSYSKAPGTLAIDDITPLLKDFSKVCTPIEETLYILTDSCTQARYCECHIPADRLIELGTIDVPLDPEEQAEYRANRELAEDHAAFDQMKFDAGLGRTFSNIVLEFEASASSSKPLKIIGGQHRYVAIEEAQKKGVNQTHGVKVYFDLNSEQRLDVQLISNTNIQVSVDLLDRMLETVSGPELRNWCQAVGFLDKGRDFADRKQRNQPITVRDGRTFIINFCEGSKIDPKEFATTKTMPITLKSGVRLPEWEQLKASKPDLWMDKALQDAGKEFAKLVKAQRDYFAKKKASDSQISADFPEKTLNSALLSAWAFVAGMLQHNKIRLQRHYSLPIHVPPDPLNAGALAKGRHKTDPENYRGLGYRSDAKERGRFVELFFEQTEKGDGITKGLIDLAIKQYHAKEALLEVAAAKAKA